MIQLKCLGFDLMVIMHIFAAIFPAMLAVDPSCNFYQNIDTQTKYFVYNSEYPGNYGPNKDCLWRAVAPEGYQVEVKCSFNIPNSPGCEDDRVLISITGQTNLENAQTFCGTGNKTLTTEANAVAIALKSSHLSKGGHFLCSLQAKQSVPAPCNCGWKNLRRIVGGVETKINEYPMMAGLIDFKQREVFCGATIIAKRYVLSAAHCFKNKESNFVGVIVGEHDLTSGTETASTRLLRSSGFLLHPNYNEKTGLDDIAIVQTETEMEYNFAVGPACLPFYYYQNSFTGETVEALGWGTTEFTGPSSDVLLKTDLDVLSYQECYQKVNGTIDQLCTYRKGHDSCQKDSGGPVLWTNTVSPRIFLVGIISNGYGCATKKPGVNTRVTSYLPWIMSSIPNTDICVRGP